jgi:hypothetical protein
MNQTVELLIRSSYFDIVQLAVLNGRFCHQGKEYREDRMKRNIPEEICALDQRGSLKQ